nr:DKNYY domain-containing protein [Oceanivirga salmonicida]
MGTIIDNMNPKILKPLNNNYYTDSEVTFYCDRMTYELKILPISKTNYYSNIFNIATDGNKIYYKGKLIPEAKAENFRAIELLHNNDKRESEVYFTDGKNVYYENKKLDIIYNENVYSVRVKMQNSMNYLHDFKHGIVYVNDILFDKNNEPYKLISKNGNHINHTLWLSENGIYFYNNYKKEIQRAGNNPFLNKNFKEIVPLVFSNGNETLYIDVDEIVSKDRNGIPSSKKTYTYINSLDNLDKNNKWEKLKDINNYGFIWKYGENAYYFDNLGETQFFKSTIYEIKDKQVLNTLLTNKDIDSEFIYNLIKDKKLIIPKHTKLLQVKTKYYYNYSNYRLIFFVFLIIFIIIFKIIYQKNKNYGNIKLK